MRRLQTLFVTLILVFVPAAPVMASAGAPEGGGLSLLIAALSLVGLGMATQTGTHTIEDLLDVEHQSVAEFGRSTVENVIQSDLENHRQLTEEMVSGLAETTTDRQRIYGDAGNTEMEEVDEFGRGTTQEDHDSGEVAFPLRKFLHDVGWTDDYEVNASPADMAQATLNAEKADVKKIREQMKKAIFKSSNYSYVDHLIDRVTLDVKRFVNADGDPIPPGPNGETFDGSTHTHYNAESGLSNGGLNDSLTDLQEHGHTDQIEMYINQADESAVKGLADFNKYVDSRLTLRDDQNQPRNQRDVSMPLDNRAIGIFSAAEVWVKPWVPSGYIFITDVGASQMPLNFRQHESAGLRGLRLAAEIRDYPLNIDNMEHYFGVGVWNRTNGVIHHHTNGMYQDPSF
jgi:hypothetical protein